jgi:hypothetical protein
MSEFIEEMRQSKRDTDKKWEDMVNKLGTIVEDILAPNLKRVAAEHFQMEILASSLRIYRKIAGTKRYAEFDVVVIGADKVILGEAKSTATIAYANDFKETLDSFFEFYPEHRHKKLIGILGSWSIPLKVAERLTALGIYGMQMGVDTMELVNAAEMDRKLSH